ncbi:PH domain-containing protein [Candidatus Gracilibacteria bacterium]|nr:PH domain-containing protein [Candidatus Gracilibacteria bacterium]MCF7819561.1 PH domain-containing protein [Candidatus Gracilibacteria bacterium]
MKTNYHDSQCYEMKQSSALLLTKMFGAEICIILLHLTFQKITLLSEIHPFFMENSSLGVLELIIFHFFNASWIFFLFLRWNTTEYVITPKEILLFEGIFSKKSTSYDIRGIQSTEISQNIFGRFLRYGTTVLENPLLKSNIALKNISNPEFYVSVIEKYHTKAISKAPLMNVFPSK